jgi:uncharacterized ferritin-like protein (DUF455 family)
MELVDYAAQILFGTRLEDKLSSPETLVDTGVRFSRALPDRPGRPRELDLSDGLAPDGAAFPRLSAFERDIVRGRVLHFFANHELLALEVMALVLLKFPEAPRSFRRGLVQTMKDEQRHLALYLEHMQRLGVGFGDVPVNGYFWRVLKSVDSPYAFSAQMGLTFEQANLDFALHYEQIFRAVGDDQTAAVMHTVFEDEIRHVRHGLQWFRHWKPQGISDWEAFKASLPFPLSPARAKGQVFSFDARKRAGFDDDFSRELSRFNQSKGRPPRVFWYNPAQELEVGVGGLCYTQSAVLSEIAHDLEPLMLLLAAPDDVVALRHPLSQSVRDELDRARIPIPELASFDSRARRVGWLRGRKCAGLVAWGASPLAGVVGNKLWEDSFPDGGEQSLGPERQSRVGDAASPVLWKPSWRQLVSKASGLNYQLQFPPLRRSSTSGGQELVAVPQACSIAISSLEELMAAMDRLFAEGNTYAVLKAPFGSSGRNQLRIGSGNLDLNQSSWIKRQLSLFGTLVAEPWRKIEAEFSWQASIERQGKVRHHGLVRNISAANGQYLASCVGKILFGLHRDVKSFLYASSVSGRLEELASCVAEKLVESGYSGPFGIDSYVYREAAGNLVFQQFSELNLRHTMGRLALQARRYAQAGRVVMLALPDKETLSAFGERGVQLMSSGRETLIDTGLVRFGSVDSARRVVPCVAVVREADAVNVLSRLCPMAPVAAN